VKTCTMHVHSSIPDNVCQPQSGDSKQARGGRNGIRYGQIVRSFWQVRFSSVSCLRHQAKCGGPVSGRWTGGWSLQGQKGREDCVTAGTQGCCVWLGGGVLPGGMRSCSGCLVLVGEQTRGPSELMFPGAVWKPATLLQQFLAATHMLPSEIRITDLWCLQHWGDFRFREYDCSMMCTAPAIPTAGLEGASFQQILPGL